MVPSGKGVGEDGHRQPERFRPEYVRDGRVGAVRWVHSPVRSALSSPPRQTVKTLPQPAQVHEGMRPGCCSALSASRSKEATCGRETPFPARRLLSRAWGPASTRRDPSTTEALACHPGDC